MISWRDCWPWTALGYITMTRRQSNNHRSGGIAGYPALIHSEVKNPQEKFSPRFYEIKTASSSLVIFQTAWLSTRSFTHLWWWNWRTFWRKIPAEISSSWSWPCTRMPRFTGHLQPRSNYPTWASNILTTHPIFRIWPRRTTTCSLDWKEKRNNLKVAIFRPTQRYFCRGELVGRTTFWIFFERLAKVRATGSEVYRASWGVCWIIPEFGRCSLFHSWSG